MRGNSPLMTLSSMAAGMIASGMIPAWASSALRRGDSLARTRTDLPEAIVDAPLGKIIRRHLHHDLVPGQHPDAVLAHFAGGMGDDDMVIGDQLHAEGRVGQQLLNNTFEFELFFLRHQSSDFCRTTGGRLQTNQPKSRAFRYPRPADRRIGHGYGPSARRALGDRRPAAVRASLPQRWGPGSANIRQWWQRCG